MCDVNVRNFLASEMKSISMYLNKKKGGNETWIMESKAQRKNNKGTKDDTARNDSQ